MAYRLMSVEENAMRCSSCQLNALCGGFFVFFFVFVFFSFFFCLLPVSCHPNVSTFTGGSIPCHYHRFSRLFLRFFDWILELCRQCWYLFHLITFLSSHLLLLKQYLYSRIHIKKKHI